jgi:capsular polysaccharide transport system permease protein
MNTDKRALPLDELDELLLDTPNKSGTSRFPSPKRFVDWFLGLNWLFIWTVLVPTGTAAFYYGFIASDVYLSDSSFVVQSVQDQEGISSQLGSFLKSSMSSSADEDTADVQEFIQSRDALRQLEAQTDLRDAYGNSKIDFVTRFGGLKWWDKSFEALFLYYSKWVVDVEPSQVSSSITEVEVRAFSPDEAALINKNLLDMGEKLVNQLNDRLQQDLVRFAQEEVDEAEKKAEAAYVALADYRNSNVIVDPDQQSSIQLGLIEKLQENLIDTRNQLAEVTRSSANNPQVPALRNQIYSLESEISAEMAKTAGAVTSLSSKASEYEKLTFERDFSEKQLTEALTFLDRSRDEAQRKELYLKRIVEPNAPDYPMEPRRVRNTLAVFVLGLVTWGIISLFAAGVREHQQ